MRNKLVVIINSLKVPKIKKILLYEMKFLNYSCLQNPWLVSTGPRSPFSLSSFLNSICWTPPNKIPWYATAQNISVRDGHNNSTSQKTLLPMHSSHGVDGKVKKFLRTLHLKTSAIECKKTADSQFIIFQFRPEKKKLYWRPEIYLIRL